LNRERALEILRALDKVEETLKSREFLKWLEDHEEEIEADYLSYSVATAKAWEEPISFELYALRRFIAPLVKEEKIDLLERLGTTD